MSLVLLRRIDEEGVSSLVQPEDHILEHLGLLGQFEIIREPAGVSIAVKPHVQGWADFLEAGGFSDSFGTYPGHEPDITLAVDVFVDVSDPTQGNRICDAALDHWEQVGFDYMIFRQRIWNPEITPSWRAMEDRGGITANHYDHVHFSFEPTGQVLDGDIPVPTTNHDDEDLAMLVILGMS